MKSYLAVCGFWGAGHTGSDSNRYKFTGKERDAESNLDNFGARYYTSNIGRFMSPDWAARPTAVPYAVFGDPQSLNLYAYVSNDPISRADADGHQGSCVDPQNPASLSSESHEDPCKNEKQQSAEDATQNKTWWQKALKYFYYKGGNSGKGGTGFGISDVKVGPVRVDVVAKKGTTEVKQTVDGKTISTVSETGIKAGIGPVKLGLDRTTTQEDGKAPVTETTIIGGVGKFEGSSAEFGIGVGGCFIVCSQIEVGVQADKVVDDVKDFFDNANPGPNANLGPGTQPN